MKITVDIGNTNLNRKVGRRIFGEGYESDGTSFLKLRTSFPSGTLIVELGSSMVVIACNDSVKLNLQKLIRVLLKINLFFTLEFEDTITAMVVNEELKTSNLKAFENYNYETKEVDATLYQLGLVHFGRSENNIQLILTGNTLTRRYQLTGTPKELLSFCVNVMRMVSPLYLNKLVLTNWSRNRSRSDGSTPSL